MSLHHPDDSALASYAAGTLRPGFDLVLAAHLERCPSCQGIVRGFEAVAGDLLFTTGSVDMAAGSLGAALGKLDDLEKAAPATDTRLITERLPLGRRRWVAPGTWTAPVLVDHAAGDRIYLLNVAPGLGTPEHGHHGVEYTCVLSGSLIDGDAAFGPGDFLERDEDHRHQPRNMFQAPCVCLVASTGRLKVDDWVGRLLQWLGNF